MTEKSKSFLTKVFDFYNGFLLRFAPEDRIYVAVAIIVVLVVLLLYFVKKHAFWLLLFVILVPSAVPAIRTILAAIWEFLRPKI